MGSSLRFVRDSNPLAYFQVIVVDPCRCQRSFQSDRKTSLTSLLARLVRPQEFSRFNVECRSKLLNDLQASVELALLKLGQITSANTCIICEIVLRKTLRIP